MNLNFVPTGINASLLEVSKENAEDKSEDIEYYADEVYNETGLAPVDALLLTSGSILQLPKNETAVLTFQGERNKYSSERGLIVGGVVQVSKLRVCFLFPSFKIIVSLIIVFEFIRLGFGIARVVKNIKMKQVQNPTELLAKNE